MREGRLGEYNTRVFGFPDCAAYTPKLHDLTRQNEDGAGFPEADRKQSCRQWSGLHRIN
jgi:hypothetical protein